MYQILDRGFGILCKCYILKKLMLCNLIFGDDFVNNISYVGKFLNFVNICIGYY